MSRFVWLRIILIVLAGNALGFLSNYYATRLVVPWLWSLLTSKTPALGAVALIALTAMAMATPPVLLGALGAWLAGREQTWVGFACGLWGLTLISLVPEYYPIEHGIWYAPTILVILSSTIGGWMVDLSSQAEALRRKFQDEDRLLVKR